MSGVLIKRGSLETDTEERRPREDRGRDLSYAAISQETPGNAGREKVGFPPRVQRKNGAADISILDCWPPEP